MNDTTNQPISAQPEEHPPRRQRRTLFVVVFIMIGLFGAGMLAGAAITTSLPEPKSVLAAEQNGIPGTISEAWSLIHERYVDTKAIDNDRMVEGAITGMLATLGDEGHTRYLNPDQVAQHQEGLSGSFVGIGIRVEQRDGQIIVVAPIDGSPAERAGVRAGDILLRVDGQSIEDMPLEEVVNQIRGEAGTDVRVRFSRPGQTEDIDLTLERAELEVSAVEWVMLPDGNALIRLSQFSQGSAAQLTVALEEISESDAAGIVLDLRNNPGGYVHEAIGIASQFLPRDTPVFIAESRDGGKQVHHTEAGLSLTDLPMIVLINQGSASASEIVSGALQAAGRAELVGETTFGTGTVLAQFGLSDGSAILLGTELWLTPEGEAIRGQGISPDVRVVLTPRDTPVIARGPSAKPVTTKQIEADPQLRRALGILRGEPVLTTPNGGSCAACR